MFAPWSPAANHTRPPPSKTNINKRGHNQLAGKTSDSSTCDLSESQNGSAAQRQTTEMRPQNHQFRVNQMKQGHVYLSNPQIRMSMQSKTWQMAMQAGHDSLTQVKISSITCG
tara:strand:+ start:190 stop:528 length:339 start_codon:yes stop_codon:yes gene_type:complete